MKFGIKDIEYYSEEIQEDQDLLIVFRIENDPGVYEQNGYWVGFYNNELYATLKMYSVDEMKFKEYLSECKNYLERCVIGIDYIMKCSRITYREVLRERK